MDWKDFVVVAIRAAALSVDLAGKTHAASTLYKLADRIEAGENVDAYMGEIAKLLKSRSLQPSDWMDIYDKIHLADTRLDSDGPGEDG